MIYNLLKKVIVAENEKLEAKAITKKEYNAWKKELQTKMDTFLLCERITDEQYRELTDMLQ